MVTVNCKMAITTLINSQRKRHLLPGSAPAAILAGVRGVHFFKRPSSVFSFGFRYVEKVPPRHVIDGFGEMVVLDHPVDVQGFNLDSVEAVYNIPRNFMVKVFSTIGDALMFERNYPPGFAPVRAAFDFAGKFTLRLCQFGSGFLQVARVGDGFTVRQSGKICYARVNPDTQAGNRQRRGFFHLAHQADVPTAGTSGNSQLFNRAFNFTREAHAATTNTRHKQFVALQRAFMARVNLLAETIVAVFAFESGKAGFLFTLFQSAKESVKSQVQSFQHVGLDVPVTIQDVGQFFLGLSQLSGLFVEIERFAFASQRESLAKVANPVFEAAIPEKAALIQSLFTRFHERFVGAQFELKSLCASIRFSHAGNSHKLRYRLGLGRGLRLSLSRLYFTLWLIESKATAH